VCCSVLQCVAVCCGVLQCPEVCGRYMYICRYVYISKLAECDVELYDRGIRMCIHM